MWHFNCNDCRYNGKGRPSWDIIGAAESHGHRRTHTVKVWQRGHKVEARTVGRQTIGEQ